MDKMIIIQTFTMARWQIVVKMSEATKQTKDQNKKTTHSTGSRCYRTENTLLAGTSVYLSSRKFDRLGSEGVNYKFAAPGCSQWLLIRTSSNLSFSL